MKISHSLTNLSDSKANKRILPSAPHKVQLSQTVSEVSGDSPYIPRLDAKKKIPHKTWKATPSGAVPFSADQCAAPMPDTELPQAGSYLPPRDKGKLWTPEQLKFIDKYCIFSLEATIKRKTELITDLQRELNKSKSDLKRLMDDKQKSPSPTEFSLSNLRESGQIVSSQHHKLLEKSIDQSKKLKDLGLVNKEQADRIKELERLFLNAKTKLDQAEARGNRLARELAQTSEKHEDLTALNEYYRTMKLKAIHLMGQMTKSPAERRVMNMRFMELDDAHVPILIDILKQFPYVEVLDLEGNQISDSGVKILCDYLKSLQCHVSNLNLNWNSVGLEGAWALAEAIMGRDYQIENNIAKVSLTDTPVKISRVSLNFNRLDSHTALIAKVWEFLKKTQKDTIKELNLTRKALTRASAKTVGQAFKAVNETFADQSEIKALTAVLDRIHIEQHDLDASQMESRKIEERSNAVKDFHTQLSRLQTMTEAAEKSSLFASVLHSEEKNIRRKWLDREIDTQKTACQHCGRS